MARHATVTFATGASRVSAASYDPEGLFANKARLKTKLGDMDKPRWLRDVRKLPREALDERGGASIEALGTEVRRELADLLAEEFLPIDLDAPGVKVLHLDPPVFTVDGFLTPEECDAFVEETLRSETLRRSTVGEGNLESQRNQQSESRTSSSVLLSQELQAKHKELGALAQRLQSRTKELISLDQWSPVGVLPGPGQVCFEALQVAVYRNGEHFLSHEDGFPQAVTQANGFQRVGTVLLYLNDVEAGGRTSFGFLDLAVQPRKGMALIFFPGFSNCESDPRTIHTAEDAVDEKWVCQQWIARGVPASNPSSQGNDPSVQELPGERFRNQKKGKLSKAKKAPSSKGFGAR